MRELYYKIVSNEICVRFAQKHTILYDTYMIRGKKLFDKVKPFAAKLAAAGNMYRMSILYLLAYGPLEAGSIASALGISNTLTSHHLKELHSNGWVVRTRDGRRLIYKVNDRAFYRINELFFDTPFGKAQKME